MKPYENCESCPRCWSGKCQQCPKLRAELRAFKQQTEGKVHAMAMRIWHPRMKPFISLQSLSTEQLGEATSASMKEGLPRNSKLGTRGIATEVGKHFLSGAPDSTHLAGKISEKCSGSNPDGSVPARLFLSGNLLSLQDIGGQISMARYHPISLLADKKHAGVFSRYVTNFQSRVFPPACPPINMVIT